MLQTCNDRTQPYVLMETTGFMVVTIAANSARLRVIKRPPSQPATRDQLDSVAASESGLALQPVQTGSCLA